jgi:hypothetical protein
MMGRRRVLPARPAASHRLTVPWRNCRGRGGTKSISSACKSLPGSSAVPSAAETRNCDRGDRALAYHCRDHFRHSPMVVTVSGSARRGLPHRDGGRPLEYPAEVPAPVTLTSSGDWPLSPWGTSSYSRCRHHSGPRGDWSARRSNQAQCAGSACAAVSRRGA